MRAFIIVDLQKDFLPRGALAVKDGDKIVPVVDHLLNKKWDKIVASKDWHPKEHGSFAVNHNKKVGEEILLDNIPQILWPVHCVQETPGAEFAPDWDYAKVECVFYKGVDKQIDSYSTFFDNDHRRATGLGDYLKELGITDVYLAGLATDYCIKYSALDSVSLGFNTYVIRDACRAVDLREGDGERALREIKKRGAHIITSDQV